MQPNLNMKVEEFTSPNPNWVYEETSLKKVKQMMIDLGIRHVLVYGQGEEICGLISERDVLANCLSPSFDSLEAKDIMATELFVVSPESRLSDVAFEMSSKKVGSAVVIDESTGFKGIFTVTDALNALVEILRGDFQSELKGQTPLS